MPRSVRQPEKLATTGQKREQTKPRNYIFPHFFALSGKKVRKNFCFKSFVGLLLVFAWRIVRAHN